MTVSAEIKGEFVQLSGNPVEIECSGGVPPAGTTGYQILLKAISTDGKLEKFPKTDAVTPGADGKALFDLSGYVDQPIKAQFQFPVSGAVVSYTTQACNVQVQPGESYINSEGIRETNWFSESAVFQILKGGLTQRQMNMMREAETNFYQFYLLAGKFLTARPWGEFVHPTQPVKLWFMVDTMVSVTFKIKAVYTDNTDETYSENIMLNGDTLYEFNCNPANHEIDMESGGERIKYFDVWLESFGTKISETRRFTVDWEYCERPTFLFFANSFGGVDDVYFRGRIQDNFGMEKRVAYKPATRTDTVKDPTRIVTSRKGMNKWLVNTGHKSLTTMQYYRDLLVSEQVWYAYGNVGQTTFNIIPVIIESYDGGLANRREDLHSGNIEFSEAHDSAFTFDNRSF